MTDKILIYGAGAMGTVLGAYLSRAGANVLLVTRNSSHVNALNEGGARISGGAEFCQKVRACTPENLSGRYDVIFLMTKQRENPEICRFLQDYMTENGVVCTMQNGLPERGIAEILGEDRTLGCAVSFGATFLGAGRVELTSSKDKMTFALGSLSENPERIKEVAEILSLAGKVEICDNFLGARYVKLSINSAFSSLSAISGLTFGQIASERQTRPLALALLQEAFAVAKAQGIKVEPIQGHDVAAAFGSRSVFWRKKAYILMHFAMKKHKNIVSGMYYDLVAGKRCDIDFINGVIARLGDESGVDTPVNDKVLSLAAKIERGEEKPSPELFKSL